MKLLLMLEDDHDRIRRFRAIVARHHPDAVLKIARTAPDFKTEYWTLNDTPDLIFSITTYSPTHRMIQIPVMAATFLRS